MLRPFGLSAVTGILFDSQKEKKRCRWINRKLFLDGKEMDGCLKYFWGSGVGDGGRPAHARRRRRSEN